MAGTGPNRNRRFGYAWLGFAAALAVHVLDEATHDFLYTYKPAVQAIRARIPFLPLPTFTFGLWLSGLLAGVALLVCVSPLAFRGARWMRLAAWPLSIVVGVFNASLHMLSSVYYRRWMPGVYSSPLLLLAALFLFVSARSQKTGAARLAVPDNNQPLPRLATGVAIALCAAKFLLHAVTSMRNYGYFRDELYYLDMARHLDWGYVDAAPLVAVYAKLALLMGGSLAALRMLPALAGAALVVLSMLIARELGGNRYAQSLTGLAVLLCPAVLWAGSLMTINAFEPLYWMGCILVIARFLRTGDSHLWLWFGVLAGLGLENKHSTLIFGFAVTVALLITQRRREFLKPWIWIAGGIALALFLPNLIWQVQHHFPTIEDLRNVQREGKNVVLGPLAFVKEQIFDVGPILFPVWLAGLIWFLRERRWRLLGFTFVVFFVVMELEHAKNYYLFPIYPFLLAGGTVVIERCLALRANWTRAAVAAVIVVASMPLVPLVTWMLSPEQYIAYGERIGVKLSKAEVAHAGPLPQPIGDQFGWPEMARQVADIYHSLPPAERAQTGIWAGNYGEAGAINLFGPQYGLPRAYSRHQTHWYWGPPPMRYNNLIVVQWGLDDVRDNCTSWRAFDRFERFGMAEENTPIYLCRGVKFDIQKIWWHGHHWN